MHEVKWENANALEIELLVAMAMDGYEFQIADGKIQAGEVQLLS